MSDTNKLSAEQEEILALLIEEAAEVQQSATKILRHGVNVDHPTMGKWNNKKELEIEIADFLVVIQLLSANKDVDELNVARYADKKARELRKWTHNIDWSKYDAQFGG